MNKNQKQLLSEELKRFNAINEYSFHVPDEPEDTKDLLLGDINEEDPEGEPEEVSPEPAGEDGAEDAEGLEAELDAEMGGDEFADEPDMGGDETELDADMELSVDEPEDEVELDVTELVNSTDAAKQAADNANNKIDQLLGSVSKLESQLSSFQGIGDKIDNLENELEKRAPTPEEKIEMRSFDSYPYNLKLTDFWADQKGKYDVLGTDDEEGTPEEYVLTKDDVDSDYSELQVKNSLDTSNPYEEEDV
jgi:hypothetical protein